MSILTEVNGWGIPLLLERNIANQDEMEKFLGSLRATKPEAKKWIKSNLRNYLLNTHEEVEPVGHVENPPAWLKAAMQRGDEVLNIRLTHDFKTEIEHVVDWLESDAVPADLSRVSVPQAIKHSQQWLADLIAGDKKTPGEVEVVKKYKDGFSWVELLDQEALTHEGQSMGHCVGSYCERVKSGNTRIWSLRDSKGEPHCTIEITGQRVVQIKGKENRDVVEKYHSYVKDILANELAAYEAWDLQNIGLIEINGKRYDLNNLPSGSVVKGDLDLSRTKISALPSGLEVKGNLNLSGTSISALPSDLKVGGNLYLRETPISSLPPDLQVGGSLDLSGTNISSLPSGLVVKGTLDLTGTKISALPPDLQVGGSLALERTQISALPSGLEVKGSLYLDGTKISSLPSGLAVKGNLDLRGTNISSLPKDLFVIGWLDLRGTNISSLPSDLKAFGFILVDNPAEIKCSEEQRRSLRS